MSRKTISMFVVLAIAVGLYIGVASCVSPAVGSPIISETATGENSVILPGVPEDSVFAGYSVVATYEVTNEGTESLKVHAFMTAPWGEESGPGVTLAPGESGRVTVAEYRGYPKYEDGEINASVASWPVRPEWVKVTDGEIVATTHGITK